MGKRTLGIIVLIFILISIPASVYLVKRRQEIRKKAAPATILSFSPATITKKVGDVFEVRIQINTGENQVVGADLDLSFNTQILEALTINPGDFLDNPEELARNIDNQTGRIIYSLGSFTPEQGSGALALLSFKAKTEGTSPLSFDSETSVAGIGETEALQNTIAGSITVLATEPTPTPTSEPTPTPTILPSPSPTPTLSPSPTPTPTPTPGPTATPIATPTPSPTSTPTPTPITRVAVPSTEKEIPEPGIFTPTFLLLISGGTLLALGFLCLLL